MNKPTERVTRVAKRALRHHYARPSEVRVQRLANLVGQMIAPRRRAREAAEKAVRS